MEADTQITAYASIQTLAATLQGTFVATLATSLIIVCVFEILKIPGRALFHFLMLHRWVKARMLALQNSVGRRSEHRSSSFDEGVYLAEIALGQLEEDYRRSFLEQFRYSRRRRDPFITRPSEFPRMPPLSAVFALLTFSLPSALFLKQFENIARQSMDSQEDDPLRFLFAAGSNVNDFHHFRRNPPSEPIEFEEARTRAYARLSDQTERNLDELQVRVIFWWPTIMRLSSALAGVVLFSFFTTAFVTSAKISVAVLILMGIVAGYLSSIINDLVGVLRDFRRSRS